MMARWNNDRQCDHQVNILNAHDVNRLLDYSGLIEALRAAHRVGSMPRSEAMVMGEPPDEANKFVSLVAWAPKDVIAVKLVGVFPGNLSLPVPEPSVQGLVLLFSGATGRPLFACDGATLTFRKTAADWPWGRIASPAAMPRSSSSSAPADWRRMSSLPIAACVWGFGVC